MLLGRRVVGWILVAGCLWCGVIQPASAEELAPAVSTSRFSRCKEWVKSHFVRQKDTVKFGLRLDENWRTLDAKREVVILLHGFNATADPKEALMQTVRDAGYPCGVFNYPNDDRLDKAAALLAQDLRTFAAEHPQRRVALLAYSAGGLAARACLEDPVLDPGNVTRLIMIATPNHGTVLARAAVGMDVCEHGWRIGRGGTHAAIADGMGEMREDLEPCSDFLTRLNARERNPKVSYTMLLGTGGPVSKGEMSLFRYVVRKSTAKIPYVGETAKRLDSKLDEFDEVIYGAGDGAVAVRRARLDGVKDTLLIPFSHLNVTGPADNTAVRLVHAEVLQRLYQKSPSAAE